MANGDDVSIGLDFTLEATAAPHSRLCENGIARRINLGANPHRAREHTLGSGIGSSQGCDNHLFRDRSGDPLPELILEGDRRGGGSAAGAWLPGAVQDESGGVDFAIGVAGVAFFEHDAAAESAARPRP